MREITVQKKQSLYDMCLQLYGSTDYLSKLAADSGVRIDVNILPGQTLVYDETIGDLRIRNKSVRGSLVMVNPIPLSDQPTLANGWTDGQGTPFTDGLGVQFTFET